MSIWINLWSGGAARCSPAAAESKTATRAKNVNISMYDTRNASRVHGEAPETSSDGGVRLAASETGKGKEAYVRAKNHPHRSASEGRGRRR